MSEQCGFRTESERASTSLLSPVLFHLVLHDVLARSHAIGVGRSFSPHVFSRTSTRCIVMMFIVLSPSLRLCLCVLSFCFNVVFGSCSS